MSDTDATWVMRYGTLARLDERERKGASYMRGALQGKGFQVEFTVFRRQTQEALRKACVGESHVILRGVIETRWYTHPETGKAATMKVFRAIYATVKDDAGKIIAMEEKTASTAADTEPG